MMNKNTNDYAFYSKVLKQVFDSVDELKFAEETYYKELKAKEDKAAAKKADALVVEEAFKALNTARKNYKDDLIKITDAYQKALKSFKADFEGDRAQIQKRLAEAETTYSNALRAFTEKYPEGYHLTLKDGDFETTISSQTASSNKKDAKKEETNAMSLLDLLFNL